MATMAGADELAPPQRVLAVSARFTARPELVNLMFTLKHAGVRLDSYASIDEALSHAPGPPIAECMLLDASFATELPEARIHSVLEAALAHVHAAAPEMPPLLMVTQPTIALVTAAFRAGAADVFDPATIEKPHLLRALGRARADYKRRMRRALLVGELRGVVDEFLRQLVKAERRVIELEESRAAEDEAADADSAPRVLVDDDEPAIVDLLVDNLGRVGLATVVADSGEKAIKRLEESQARKEPVDLAMVDKNLPGMDGLATIKILRQKQPSLPTMIMTGFSNTESAVAAADLGVVGYVLKPFDDVRELAARVKALAARYATERRQRRHLGRIKQRHAQFLEKYVSITAQLDALKG
jgi:DNA-binding NtrC family response regulator